MYNIRCMMLIASMVISVSAQEPVDISRFLYESVVAADCAQGKAPENVCDQFRTNIELMIRAGEELQAEVQQTLNQDLGITDPRLIIRARAGMLRSIITKAAQSLRSRYDDRDIFAYVHETQSEFSFQPAFDQKKKVRQLYFNELLKNMAASDLDTYYALQRILGVHLHIYAEKKSLKSVQNAFFESAREFAAS